MGIENGGYQPPESSVNFEDLELTAKDKRTLKEIDRLRAYDQDYKYHTKKVGELERKKAGIRGVSWTKRRQMNSWIKGKHEEIRVLEKRLMQEFGINLQEIEGLIMEKETSG